ncbi:MAG TPA: UvrD-helicase domain-containing protein, partial [Gemmatimonadaceae bacterium]|nr:UvrD-helicase domain-containing protein [Gemmatimonadaceae bacterium]
MSDALGIDPTPPRAGVAVASAYDRRAGERVKLEGEQLAAVHAREATVALSAGAGSGKTTVLVERFLDLVLSDGVSPLGILAVTYTERAAAEMKERIVRRFEERGDDANRRAAESAYISTIHGFCARLLRENPLAAGVDLGFEVIDELRLGLFLDEELERLYGDEWFLNVMGVVPPRFGSKRPRLFELIRDVVFAAREFGKGVPAEESFTVDEHVAAAMRRLDEYLEREWGAARAALCGIAAAVSALTVSGPARTKAHARICELLGQLASLGALDPAWAREFCENTSFTAGVKDVDARAAIKAVLDPSRATMKALADFDRAAEERIERETIAPLKAGLYARARELRTRYERFKAERSLLDFEDLQRIALRLLARPEVRAEYAGRFRHVLLDEAQDTNDVQKALVDLLLGGADQSLFAVGDVKQAIYGFRGANVALFQGIHRGAGAGRLSLRDNYRSRAEVLGFANAVGGALWADGSLEFEELLPKFAYRESSHPAPRVELLLVEKRTVVDPRTGKEKAEDAEVSRLREGIAIAERVRRLVEGGDGVPPVEIYDAREKGYRRARYGDVAVLASRRTHFAVYERAFWELGVPVVADGGKGFFSGREIQDVLNALRVVANPLDDVALVAALRSPLFGWSDADLVRLRQAAGRRSLWKAVSG